MGYAISETGSAIGPMALTPLFYKLLTMNTNEVDGNEDVSPIGEQNTCHLSKETPKYPLMLTGYFEENKAGYTATEVVCGWAGADPNIWAGAVIKKTPVNARETCGNQPTDRWT